jgi:Cofactor assembly of complex C subunit B, CCB2/CCB4
MRCSAALLLLLHAAPYLRCSNALMPASVPKMACKTAKKLPSLIGALHRQQRRSSCLMAADQSGLDELIADDAIAKPTSVLRGITGSNFSLVAGLIGLGALLVNRVALTPYLYDSQARTDLLALIACGGLIMNGVYLLVSSRI